MATPTDAVCPPGTAFASAVDAARDAGSVGPAVTDLLGQLTDAELLWLLDGDLAFWKGFAEMAKRYNAVPYEAGRVDRLGIPGIRFTDGPRGVVVGNCTAFPVAIARAATFDPSLEQAVGDIIGAEARATGANLFAGICVNLAYAPGWGRAQESYGEDPVLLGAMGAALEAGVHPWAMTCVKHFALNSMEEGRFRVDVRVKETVMHEVYLPHFKRVVEGGADSVMSAYNAVNGQWAGQSPALLTGVLRDEWGFEGFVMTDFIWGMRDPVGSVAAGQDLEMPFRQQRAATLPTAFAAGTVARADLERAASRLLTAQIKFALRARPTPGPEVIASKAHRDLAREAARRSMVLLRNSPVNGSPVLPLDGGTVAVFGALADQPNQGDVGSSRVYPPSSSTVLDGLRARLGERVVLVSSQDPEEAAKAAADVDAAVVVVGLSSLDEGESLVGVDTDATQLIGGVTRFRPAAVVLGRVLSLVTKLKKWGGDRRDLRLHADDVALIRAVGAVNPRTVVVVIGGGTVIVDPWDCEVAGVLLAWYPGMEGGNAVADVLLGDAEPGGRLPVAIPHRRSDLPVVDWDARQVTYGRWWGQRKLDRDGIAAAYPFGFGLGYTTFELDGLCVGPVDGECFSVSVTVRNTAARAGRHVVQVYGVRDCGRKGRVARDLLGFESVALEAGASRTVEVSCSTRPLQEWTGDGFVLSMDAVVVEAASYSGDPTAVAGTLKMPVSGG